MDDCEIVFLRYVMCTNTSNNMGSSNEFKVQYLSVEVSNPRIMSRLDLETRCEKCELRRVAWVLVKTICVLPKSFRTYCIEPLD